MKTLTFTRAHDLAQLHDQILAAVPALAGTYAREDGAQEPKLRVEGVGDVIRLTVPDDADEGAIAAVVAAHEPSGPSPNPFAILRSLLEFTEGPEDLKLILDAQFELLGG